MDDRNKELTPPSGYAAPPPPEHCASSLPGYAASPPPEFTLPPELLPPDTALPGEKTTATGTAALKAKAAKWKKMAYILVGGSALAASLLLGDPGAAAPDSVPGADNAPAAYEEYAASGTLHYTVYNDTFSAGGEPLILAQSDVDVSALADAPLSLPQPEAPAYGSYQFLGWVARYDTSAGQRWTRVEEPLTAAFAARIKPGDDGSRALALHAAWQRTEESRYPWTLRLDDGTDVTEYDAAVPMASGGSVYLCAYPEPVRAGYRFTGWLDANGAEVDTLSAADFFARSADGQTDWQTPLPVTLTAAWEKE